MEVAKVPKKRSIGATDERGEYFQCVDWFLSVCVFILDLINRNIIIFRFFTYYYSILDLHSINIFLYSETWIKKNQASDASKCKELDQLDSTSLDKFFFIDVRRNSLISN